VVNGWDVKVSWPDLNEITDLEAADLSKKKAEAIAVYIEKGLHRLLTPLDYLVKVCGWELDEAVEALTTSGALTGLLDEPGTDPNNGPDNGPDAEDNGDAGNPVPGPGNGPGKAPVSRAGETG
jgi:hypothetical protein